VHHFSPLAANLKATSSESDLMTFAQRAALLQAVADALVDITFERDARLTTA
jgi:hypothetical protein